MITDLENIVRQFLMISADTVEMNKQRMIRELIWWNDYSSAAEFNGIPPSDFFSWAGGEQFTT